MNISIRNLLQRSMIKKLNLNPTKKNPVNHEEDAENTPPLCHPNTIQIDGHDRVSDKSVTFDTDRIVQSESPSEREAAAATDKRESAGSVGLCAESASLDPSVKVVVRIRPVNEHEQAVDRAVKKISSDSLSVEDRKFTFDSVFDSNSSQEEIFQLVGIPLVKDALVGYNASILSYGQTGTGKTYTMWGGPPNAMIEDPSPRSHHGIVPRLFQTLFSEIEKEQMSKQRNYQCRCSFLEIYNEQIGDLLDPAQRNLEIKDDPKIGTQVENLTEKYVTSYEDVIQILIKGLSSRKVGAMSTNSESSRCHTVFTFVIESWCKGTSSNSFGSSRSSRINFVDLAGLDRNKLDNASGQCVSNEKNVKKSLSQLGHVVDTLASGTQPAKTDSLYRGSSLTHLLRDSLGANAKLTVICAISPDIKNNFEILSTLRFGQRVKSIRNEPVINKIPEYDVNDINDQIHQLKDELINAKSDPCNIVGSKNGYFKGRNARDSLKHLRVSLNRSLVLLNTDNDFQEDVNVDEEDIRDLRQQLDNLHGSCEMNFEVQTDDRDSTQLSAVEECCESEFMSDDEIDRPDGIEKIKLEKLQIELPPNLQEPVLSESPKFKSTRRKSMPLSASLLASESIFSKNSISNALRESFKQTEMNQSLSRSRSSKVLPGPTESLATSLQKGLQIIDYHKQNLASKKSSVSFSFEHLALQSCPEADKGNDFIQTLPEDRPFDGSFAPVLCASCRETTDNYLNEQVSRDPEYISTESANKLKDLEKVCMKQAAKIEHLNHLVEQCKSEKIHSSSEHGQEIIPFEDGNKFSETMKEKCEIKEVQCLRSKLQSTDKLRSSLLSRSIQWRKSIDCRNPSEEELENERQRWTEMESEWICLTDELRMDIETSRQRGEEVEMELRLEKKCTEELDDALQRSVVGHARMLEHYTELQEKYNDLVGKHSAIMEGIVEIKKAAAKAGKKGPAKFAKSMAAELSAVRVEKEREREQLKKENKCLKNQLRDTAEAVHAAGELLVRLRESEEATVAAEENMYRVEEENEKLKNQLEKSKRKHKTEMTTMKQYMAESKLPKSALYPLYREEDSETTQSRNLPLCDDDQAWRAEFGAIYQEHY